MTTPTLSFFNCVSTKKLATEQTLINIRKYYPDAYFMSRAADALWKMHPGTPITKHAHKVHHLTPPDYAIGPNGELDWEAEKEYETE